MEGVPDPLHGFQMLIIFTNWTIMAAQTDKVPFDWPDILLTLDCCCTVLGLSDIDTAKLPICDNMHCDGDTFPMYFAAQTHVCINKSVGKCVWGHWGLFITI